MINYWDARKDDKESGRGLLQGTIANFLVMHMPN